jgi:hypothetical protein
MFGVLHSIQRLPARSLCFTVVAVAWAACGESEPTNAAATPPSAGAAAPEPAAGTPATACVRPPGCDDIVAPSITATACCTAVTPCGYELPPLDPETEKWYPQVREFVANLTKGDPNGRCAPDSVFLGPRPGLWKHRVEPEHGEDILITDECESYILFAFILPGCCLPDNTCGLSTDESWPSFESFVPNAPFAKPECVSAAVLNQQFRDSGTLVGFARTIAGGTCNYAALSAELPPSQ